MHKKSRKRTYDGRTYSGIYNTGRHGRSHGTACAETAFPFCFFPDLTAENETGRHLPERRKSLYQCVGKVRRLPHCQHHGSQSVQSRGAKVLPTGYPLRRRGPSHHPQARRHGRARIRPASQHHGSKRLLLAVRTGVFLSSGPSAGQRHFRTPGDCEISLRSRPVAVADAYSGF